MRKFVIATAAFGWLLPAASAQTASGPVLWQNVHAGMSEVDLSAARPAIQPSERAAFVEKGVQVAGMSFDAYYEVSADGLVSVQLQGRNANVPSLIDGLSAKYGAASSPYRCDAPSSPARKCTAVWNAPEGVAVAMTVMFAPGLSITALKYARTDSTGL